MGRYGNLKKGLLREMLEVIYEHDQTRKYDSNWITARVNDRGFWKRRSPKTPERTVNSYFAQNPSIFEHCGQNQYRLRIEYYCPIETPKPIDNAEDTPAPSVKTTIYRTLRETDLVKKLKLIHGNHCQICGSAILVGDNTYSEGHHIQPLGRRGPDSPGNILILCPNHHVQCDYGGIPLTLTELRRDSRHVVQQRFIDWHNQNVFVGTQQCQDSAEPAVAPGRQRLA